MSAQFAEGQRVRVKNPSARHGHALGWEGKVARKAKGGCWWVAFMGGKALFHFSELELVRPQAEQTGLN